MQGKFVHMPDMWPQAGCVDGDAREQWWLDASGDEDRMLDVTR